MSETPRQYPPELSVEYDAGEQAGLKRIKTVPKQRQQSDGTWTPAPDLGTKQKAVATNIIHVVLPYDDAYKERGPGGKRVFPSFKAGKDRVANIRWQMLVVGPEYENEEGALVKTVPMLDGNGKLMTRLNYPILVRWSDRSQDAWVYTRMREQIEAILKEHPGTTIRDHVWGFGKKEGRSPNGQFSFSHLGLLKDHYPNVAIPEKPAGGAGEGARKPRQLGPSAAVLESLPPGVTLSRMSEQEEPTPRAPGAGGERDVDLFDAEAASPSAEGFAPTQTEVLIAQVLNQHMAAHGTSVREVCQERNITPYLLIYNSFTKGSAKHPETKESMTTDPARAEVIGHHPHLVGIKVD